jgi:hypothetical protein
MPSYQVIEKGFYGGSLYDPAGKRRTLHVEKPFKKCPSWLKPLKAESATVAKKRVTAEKKVAKADAKKAADDTAEIKGASFMGDGENGSTVETL